MVASVDVPRPSVAVIGGGVAGLVAARRLALLGADVTLLEAGPRLGGQLRSEVVAGHPIDVGAEALHLAGPHVTGLVTELGLADELVTSAPGFSWIWTGRRLRRLPAGVGPAGPTRLAPVVTGRVLSPRGVLRAAAEPLIPGSVSEGDVSVGALLSKRFGRQVTERLVDPLLGSLHAGDVSRLSARAVTPQLVADATSRRSLLLARRGQATGVRVPFATLPRGLGSLPDRLLGGTGVVVRRSTAARSIVPVKGRHRVEVGAGEALTVDAVVLAVPALVAGDLLEPVAPRAAAHLVGLRSASVVTVLAAYPRRAVEATPALRATGLLVPSSAGRLLKAATFLSSKWPHLSDPAHAFVRLSAGRAGSSAVADLDDEELVERLHGDLTDATGLATGPTEVHVCRWPNALTQLEVGHLERIESVRRELRDHPGIVLAGASYEGLGVSACVRSGLQAAAAVHDGAMTAAGR